MARGVDIYGTVLRELREDRGWSATELAEHAKAVAKVKATASSRWTVTRSAATSTTGSDPACARWNAC
ncbi:MAG: hypothetical protein ACRDZ4_19995 [Egibacteraceae bacterium]